MYDCYHGLLKTDTFVGLQHEANCDLKKANFFISDLDNIEKFEEKIKEKVLIGDYLRKNGGSDAYASKAVKFKCGIQCFMQKKISEIKEAFVFNNFINFILIKIIFIISMIRNLMISKRQ